MSVTRVLVTGGGGFVGANLVRRLLHEGRVVHVLVRPGSDTWRLDELVGQVELHVVSVGDAPALSRVVRGARPHWVFNLAAHGAYSWQIDDQRMVEVNLTGTMHLLHALEAWPPERIVHVGSSSEYGRSRAPHQESQVPAPESPYGVTKAGATLYSLMWSRRQQVRVDVARLYSVYGPFEEPRRFVPELLVAAMAGTLPKLAQPETVRDFIHVDDVVSALLALTQTEAGGPGEVFNVGTGRQTSLAEVVSVVCRLFPVKMTPEWGQYPARDWDTDVWVADASRIRKHCGWSATIGLDKGLTMMAAWLRACGLNQYKSHAGLL